jgi:hypothetical protein
MEISMWEEGFSKHRSDATFDHHELLFQKLVNFESLFRVLLKVIFSNQSLNMI